MSDRGVSAVWQVVAMCMLFVLAIACGNNYSPKPRGYYRFDLPEKSYHKFDSIGYPYKFEYPDYGVVVPDTRPQAEPYWANVVFPQYKATIYLSYIPLKDNLPQVLENVYQLVYKHTVKADDIREQGFVNPDKNVYGFLYELDGNTATAIQFYVTDSVANFIRGALYFYAEPNKDSLAPLINFFKADIQQLISTTEWATAGNAVKTKENNKQ